MPDLLQLFQSYRFITVIDNSHHRKTCIKQRVIGFLFVYLCTSIAVVSAETGIVEKTKYRGYLGVRLTELSPEEQVRLGLKKDLGVKILDVMPDSPAEKANLIAGDVILSINRSAVRSVQAVVKKIQDLGAGVTVKMFIMRNAKKKKVSVTLVPNPQDLLEEPDSSSDYFKVKIFRDIPYFIVKDKDSDKHKLNLILPITENRFPLLMWIHGGGWSFGDRSLETALGVRFAERGIGFAAINHRLSSGSWMDRKHLRKGVKHPEHIKDCARALAWLRINVRSYGSDPNCIFVGGYSSGAHLATLLAADSRYLNDLNITTGAISAVIAVGGAYDLVKYHEFLVDKKGKDFADAHLKTVFGPNDRFWEDASPTNYLQNCNVPMLVIAERDEGLRQYLKDFRQAAKKANIDFIRFLVAEDRSHKESPGMMSQKCEDPIRDAIIRFIQDRSKAKIQLKVINKDNKE